MKKRTIVLTALLAGCLMIGCQGKEAQDNTAEDKTQTETGNEKKEDTKAADDSDHNRKKIIPVKNHRKQSPMNRLFQTLIRKKHSSRSA